MNYPTPVHQCIIPKYNGVEIERILNDPSCGRPGPQDVLFCRQVIWSLYSLQVAKIAATNTSMQHANAQTARKKQQ